MRPPAAQQHLLRVALDSFDEVGHFVFDEAEERSVASVSAFLAEAKTA